MEKYESFLQRRAPVVYKYHRIVVDGRGSGVMDG